MFESLELINGYWMSQWYKCNPSVIHHYTKKISKHKVSMVV